VGISGAIQQLAGMKDPKVIVAINEDDEVMHPLPASWRVIG
jgi:electron transfer flavoprotein alpha subunit